LAIALRASFQATKGIIQCRFAKCKYFFEKYLDSREAKQKEPVSLGDGHLGTVLFWHELSPSRLGSHLGSHLGTVLFWHGLSPNRWGAAWAGHLGTVLFWHGLMSDMDDKEPSPFWALKQNVYMLKYLVHTRFFHVTGGHTHMRPDNKKAADLGIGPYAV